MQCPACNAMTPDGAHFCPDCGLALTYSGEPVVASVDDTADVSAPVAPRPVVEAGAATEGTTPITPRAVLAVLGGVGIVCGALTSWTRGYSADSFKVPVSLLFDWKSQSENPKLGYFLIGLAILSAAASFRRGNGPLLVSCGAVALGAAVLYMVQVDRAGHAFGGDVAFTKLVGPGAWILGISGLLLLISPMLARLKSSPAETSV